MPCTIFLLLIVSCSWLVESGWECVGVCGHATGRGRHISVCGALYGDLAM